MHNNKSTIRLVFPFLLTVNSLIWVREGALVIGHHCGQDFLKGIKNLVAPPLKQMGPFINNIRGPFINNIRGPFINNIKVPFINNIRGPFINNIRGPFINNIRGPFINVYPFGY